MQVAQEHRVDLERIHVSLQRTEGTVAEVQHETPGAVPDLGLHEVAARG
jgi:hypothetical protein